MNQLSKQTTIYIGLNDSETGVQKFGSEKYLSILKNACRSYKVAFSVQEINGGYFHDDGRYTEENTLMLNLIDVPEPIVMALAKDLCDFFHQESVNSHLFPYVGRFYKGNDLIMQSVSGRQIPVLKNSQRLPHCHYRRRRAGR